MSTNLPQEVQTSKVTTLPDDLKKIAEEMLAEKFGVKEVVTESGSPFSGNGKASATYVRPDDVFIDPSDVRYRGGGPDRRHYDPTRRYPDATEWGLAIDLLRRNLSISEDAGIVLARSEIRMMDMSTRMATIFSFQSMINRWMEDDMRGSRNLKEALLEQMARQYHDKMVQFPRGMYRIDY